MDDARGRHTWYNRIVSDALEYVKISTASQQKQNITRIMQRGSIGPLHEKTVVARKLAALRCSHLRL
jgi:hypothetical protein